MNFFDDDILIYEEKIYKKYKKYKGFSEKDCVCGGHNAHNIKKNKNNNSTKKKLEIRKKRLFKIQQKFKIQENL